PRWRTCSTKAAVGILVPLAAARKSARFLSRSIDRSDAYRPSGAQPLAPARAPARKHLAAARGRHPGTKPVSALAHQLARLIDPFHERFSTGTPFPHLPLSRGG